MENHADRLVGDGEEEYYDDGENIVDYDDEQDDDQQYEQADFHNPMDYYEEIEEDFSGDTQKEYGSRELMDSQRRDDEGEYNRDDERAEEPAPAQQLRRARIPASEHPCAAHRGPLQVRVPKEVDTVHAIDRCMPSKARRYLHFRGF